MSLSLLPGIRSVPNPSHPSFPGGGRALASMRGMAGSSMSHRFPLTCDRAAHRRRGSTIARLPLLAGMAAPSPRLLSLRGGSSERPFSDTCYPVRDATLAVGTAVPAPLGEGNPRGAECQPVGAVAIRVNPRAGTRPPAPVLSDLLRR